MIEAEQNYRVMETDDDQDIDALSISLIHFVWDSWCFAYPLFYLSIFLSVGCWVLVLLFSLRPSRSFVFPSF